VVPSKPKKEGKDDKEWKRKKVEEKEGLLYLLRKGGHIR